MHDKAHVLNLVSRVKMQLNLRMVLLLPLSSMYMLIEYLYIFCLDVVKSCFSYETKSL